MRIQYITTPFHIMFNFHSAYWRLFIFFACFIVLSTGCKKDPTDLFLVPHTEQTNAPKSSISISEAKNFFTTIEQNILHTASENPVQNPFYIKIEPNWENAILSNSRSGQQIVIVPLADTSLLTLNNGRVKAQLIFSKSGTDSIFAHIFLYAATPAYHTAHANNYALNNFSGAFVYFDLFYNFQFGVMINEGVPVGLVDSIGGAKINGTEDRDETCVIDDITFEITNCAMALADCDYNITIYWDCEESGGVGGGGTGGTGGGTGGTGGTGGIPPEIIHEWSWIGPLIQSGQLTYFTAIFQFGVPVNIFQYYGGQVPTNLNEYNQLILLNNLCHFNANQLEWLTDHAVLIPLITTLLSQHNNTPEWIQAVKDVIDARINGTQFFSWANMAKLIEIQKSLDLTHDQLAWLINNSVTQMSEKAVEVVYHFLQSKNFDTKAVSFEKYCINLKMQSPDYKWQRLEELYNLVENNPNKLVENCNPHLEHWSNLASFVLSGTPLQRVQNSNGTWSVQEIQNATGTRVNLDEFSVTIRTLPTYNGQQMSTHDLLEYIRKNINSFSDGKTFTPYNSYDENLWFSDSPLATVLKIDMGFADGDVICSQYEECCWVFTTLKGISGFGEGVHPVSGNRQFGIRSLGTGLGFEFSIQGADRATEWWHAIGWIDSELGFSKADELWTSLQTNVAQFINSHGGDAPTAITTKMRPKWSDVENQLKNNTPITSIPCQ